MPRQNCYTVFSHLHYIVCLANLASFISEGEYCGYIGVDGFCTRPVKQSDKNNVVL